MAEFSVNGQSYRSAKIDAMRQFHLSRKLAPIIPTLIPVFLQLAETTKASGKPLSGDDMSSLSGLLEPFAEGIASMSDEHAEYILGTCMSVVQRQQGTAWMAVWNSGQKVCMFDDIDAGAMIQIGFQVIRESLGPFISGLLSTSMLQTGQR